MGRPFDQQVLSGHSQVCAPEPRIVMFLQHCLWKPQTGKNRNVRWQPRKPAGVHPPQGMPTGVASHSSGPRVRAGLLSALCHPWASGRRQVQNLSGAVHQEAEPTDAVCSRHRG